MNTKEKSAEDLEDFWQAQFEMPISDTEFLTRSNDTDISANEILIETRGDGWLKIIKGLFLFLPGAFLLFMSSTFLFEAYFSKSWDFTQILFGVSWLILYGFIVIFGIGNVKNPKHLAFPLSIVGVSFVVYLLSLIIDDSTRLSFLSYYSIYLFPLVLAIPFVLKSFLDDKQEIN